MNSVLTSLQAKLSNLQDWQRQCELAAELKEKGWVATPPPSHLSQLAKAAVILAEKEIAEEEQRLRDSAQQAAIDEAQRQDRVVFMKTGMSKLEWEAKIQAERKK